MRKVTIHMMLVFAVLVGPPVVTEALAQDGLELIQVELQTGDGKQIEGYLHVPTGTSPDVVVIAVHPQSAGSSRPNALLVPIVKQLGIALFGISSRFGGDQVINEERLLDVAAGMQFLRKRFKTVILFGHSGGGALLALYQDQATVASGTRLTQTPAGDPPDLNKHEMPAADAFILSNAHEGRGLHLMHHIDPSIADEGDPYSVDPSLDMYSPANGFRYPPESSTYSKAFQERFAVGQRARVARIDMMARAYIAERRYFEALMARPDFAQRPLEERLFIERRAASDRPLFIYRDRADLRHTDLSIEPSDRVVGWRGGPRPDVDNYKAATEVGLIFPRMWLSDWSGLSSNCNTYESIKRIKVPLLILNGTGESGIFRSEAETMHANAASVDKQLVWVEGATHYYEAATGWKGPDPMVKFQQTVTDWIGKRFPGKSTKR